MTAQFSEILYWNDKQYSLEALPLEDYFEQGATRPDFGLPSTALRRGYQGTWEIVGGRLYLASLDGILEGGVAVAPTTVFPGTVGPVQADWYSGDLVLPTGELLSSGYMGLNRVYAETTFVRIECGRVVGVNVQPYQPLPVSVNNPQLTVGARIVQWLRGRFT